MLRGTEAGVQASSPGLGVGREGVGLPGPHVNQLYWTQLNKAFPRPVDLGGSGSQKVLEKGPSSVWGQHWTNERQESSSWPHGSSQPPPHPEAVGAGPLTPMPMAILHHDVQRLWFQSGGAASAPQMVLRGGAAKVEHRGRR